MSEQHGRGSALPHVSISAWATAYAIINSTFGQLVGAARFERAAASPSVRRRGVLEIEALELGESLQPFEKPRRVHSRTLAIEMPPAVAGAVFLGRHRKARHAERG